MKKIITLLLALTMVFGLCACAGTGDADQTDGADQASGLQVGFAKVNITPDYDVGLAGYSNAETRRNTDGFVTYIYATCLAITEGEETILVYTVDTIAIPNGNAAFYRGPIKNALGIPEEKIFFGATHCHNCPEQAGQYKEDLSRYLIEAGRLALEDRAPATMYAGAQEISGMNFVRHYQMIDGSYAGANFGDPNKEAVKHVGEVDSQMVLVKFDYADESRKDVLMVNWQTHPDDARKIGFNCIAAGFIGPLRDELEKLSGMQVAYFTGASGNVVCNSWIPSEQHNLAWDEYGIKMGQLANDALSCLKPAPGTGIKTVRRMPPMDIDHSWDHLLEEAKEVQEFWKANGLDAGNLLAAQYGFTSVYQARTIITRSAYPATHQTEMNAFSIDGVGFTTGTYEMFSDHSLYVKENSPFDTTFIITGCSGYIPTRQAYEDYRSYEADTGNYAPGVGEQLAQYYVEMLGEVK